MNHDLVPDVDPAASRRRFLKTAGLLAAPVALGALAASPASAQIRPNNVTTKQGGDQFRSIQKHENDHVAFLVGALGAAARPKPVFQNLQSPSLSAFITLSRVLENVGVGAYLGAAAVILDRGILAAAGSIAFIEARHAGYLNGYLNIPVTRNVAAPSKDPSFEGALTAQQVGNLAGPYIASLNGGPPIGYSTTPSAANDVDILNYALALEYLEAEYYNINVPIYFPTNSTTPI